MTDKLKEMIEKLKKQSEIKQEPVIEVKPEIKEEPKQEPVIEVKPEIKEDPKYNDDLQKQIQELGQKISDLQNNGIFRYELINILDSIDTSLKTIAKLFNN